MNYFATVLKQCLTDERTLYECMSRLSDKMFTDEDDRVLWNAINNLQKKGIRVTPPVLLDYLTKNTEKAAIDQLTRIMKSSIDPEQTAYSIYTIREKYNQKVLRELGEYLKTADTNIDSKELIRYSEKLLYELEEGSVDDISLDEISQKTINTIEQVQRGEQSLIIRTGLRAIDNRAPFLKSQQVLVAADNGTGKTALMIQLAKNFSELNDNIAIYFVSLDVTAEKIFRRMICNEVGITERELTGRAGKL
jgi:Replicative DNA helicase